MTGFTDSDSFAFDMVSQVRIIPTNQNCLFCLVDLICVRLTNIKLLGHSKWPREYRSPFIRRIEPNITHE
jgi:hypothetical protein